MVVKNNKIHILATVSNMSSCNLICLFTMIVWISFMVMQLVAMVTILAGKYGLHSFPTYIYLQNGKVSFVGYSYLYVICMLTEPSGHQLSETAVTYLKFGLLTDL